MRSGRSQLTRGRGTPLAGTLTLLAGLMLVGSLPAAKPAPAEQQQTQGKAAIKVLAIRPEKLEAKVGEPVRIAFDLEMPPTWHIYPAAKKPLLGKPTVFEIEGAEIAGEIEEPRPRYRRDGVLEYEYHERKVTITVPVRLTPGPKPGRRALKGRIVYQICDTKVCLNNEAPFQFMLTVLESD